MVEFFTVKIAAGTWERIEVWAARDLVRLENLEYYGQFTTHCSRCIKTS